MPVLRNARHERFAQELAKGKSATAAYIRAGYCCGTKAAEAAASRLLRNVKVAARIAEFQERAAKLAVRTVADVIAQLDEDRALAYRNKSASAAVAASMAQAKVLGLIADRTVRAVKSLDQMTKDELRNFLRKV